MHVCSREPEDQTVLAKQLVDWVTAAEDCAVEKFEAMYKAVAAALACKVPDMTRVETSEEADPDPTHTQAPTQVSIPIPRTVSLQPKNCTL